MNQHVSLEAGDFTPITDKARALLRVIRLQGCVVCAAADDIDRKALTELQRAGYVTKSIRVEQGQPVALHVQITDAGALYLDRIMRAH